MAAVTALLLASLAAAAVGLNDSTGRLLDGLLQDYHRLVAPIGDTPLNVSLGLGLLYVTPVSDSKVDVDVWVTLEWEDTRLRWDREEYQVDNIRIPQDLLWTPDIVPYNNLDVRKPSQEKFQAVVYHTGSVFVVNKATLTFPCEDHSGERECRMKFGSWMYDGFKINLLSRSESVDLIEYVPHGRISVTEASATRVVQLFACCPEPYPSVTFTFTMKEKRGWFH